MLPKDTIQSVIPYPKQSALPQTFTEVGSPRGLEAVPLNKMLYDNILLSIGGLGIFLLLTINHFLKRQYSSFYQSYFSFTGKTGSKEVNIVNLLQYIFSSIVVIGIFYYFLKAILESKLSSFVLFAYSIAIFLSYIALKSIFLFLARILVNNKILIAEQLHSTLFFNRMATLFLFGVLLMTLLSQRNITVILAYVSVSIVVIKINMQVVANYKILRAHKFSIFHSILYLCTLEVLPIVYFIIVLQALV